MDGSNGAGIAQEKLGKLKKLFPEIFSEGKVDPEKLRLSIGEDLNIQNERYVLNWAGKSDAFRVLQTPTTATLAPTSEGIGDINKTGNVFIEGENLEVLKILQKSYYGKIKMIYIDPPYNTGNDNFIYPDRFSESKDEYLKRIGEKDEEGYLLKEGLFRKNSKENGQYHSNWLSMMYPRLFLARNLLKDDGVIFVSIDDNEVHNLRLLMNEVFGEENCLDRGTLIWVNKGSTKGFNKIVKNHEYVLAYGKNAENIKSVFGLNFPDELSDLEHYCYNAPNPGNPPCEITFPSGLKIEGIADVTFTDSVGDEVKLKIVNGKMQFKNGELVKNVILRGSFPYRDQIETFFKNASLGVPTYDYKGQEWDEIFFNSKGLPRYRKSRNTLIISSVIDKKGIPNYGSADIKDIFGKKETFPFPKPKELIEHLLKYFTTHSDIVFDFFAGSGTTAHAVLDLNKEDGGNRKFILVQLPEKCKEDSEAYKAGYKTIAEIGKERIRRVIKKIVKEKKDNPDLFAYSKGQNQILRSAQNDKAGGRDPRNDNIPDLGFKVFKLKNSNFKIWRSDVIENGKDLAKQIDVFEKNVKPEAKISNMVWEILLKSGYDLNTKVEENKVNGCEVYSAAEGEIIIALSKISQSAIKEIIKLKPKRCICLDSLFVGNDQLKTNTVLQMKDAGVEFKTI